MLEALIVAALPDLQKERDADFADQIRVERRLDRGEVFELVVRCSHGTAKVTYLKDKALFCPPQGRCTSSFRQSVAEACH